MLTANSDRLPDVHCQKRQPSPHPRLPSLLPPNGKNRHHKPDQSRPPSRTRLVAPSLRRIPVQPLASPLQSPPRGVCVRGRPTRGFCRSKSSTMSSSRRRADRAHSSMPRHAARGAGFRARRPREPPLCRPLAQHRALNRHFDDALTPRARPACALTSLPGAVPTGQDRTNRSTSHVK